MNPHNEIYFGASVLVVPQTDFSVLTKLNKDNGSENHYESVSESRYENYHRCVIERYCYGKNSNICHLLLVTILAKLLSIEKLKLNEMLPYW